MAAALQSNAGQKRTTTSYTNEDSAVQGEKNIFVYFCKHCGGYATVLSKGLKEFPKRKTDLSVCVNPKDIQKRNFLEGDVKLLKRDGGAEKQYRFNCSSCGVTVAYQADEYSNSNANVYFLTHSLSSSPNIMENVLPPCIQAASDGNVRVYVEVETNRKDTKIASMSDQLVLHLRGYGRDGRDNDMALNVFAKLLKIKPSQINLEWGAQTKNKVFLFSAVSAKAVCATLREYSDDESHNLNGYED